MLNLIITKVIISQMEALKVGNILPLIVIEDQNNPFPEYFNLSLR